MSGIAFTAPWALAALVALPAIWWLLRVTPPAARAVAFPAARLLIGLVARQTTPARTPWWLLALRIGAAALLIVALAGPVSRTDRGVLGGAGPVLLVVDDGWASADDWPAMLASARATVDRAEREGRRVALLATAARPDGSAPTMAPAMEAADARARVEALRPLPWPVGRAAAASAIGGTRAGAVVYVADGLGGEGGGEEFGAFASALSAAGQVTRIGRAVAPARLMLPPVAEADRLVARVAVAASPVVRAVDVLARTGDGRVLARATVTVPAGETEGRTALLLPPELRNRLSRLELDGPPSAGGVVLLDEQWRRRPVGLLAGPGAADAPLTGPLFFVRRALSPFAELREGTATSLLARPVSMLVMVDGAAPDEDAGAIVAWVERGGTLVRFAGPGLAGQTRADPLLPERLLAGDRRLGGAMSWSTPAGLAAFAAESPFAGLAVPDDVRVSRQVLAEPSANLAKQSWASLVDGTPLVTAAARGAGRIVLVHVTANADWSNLPLSGLFVDMMRRLVSVSAGVAEVSDTAQMPPVATLDGFGREGPPPVAAAGLPAGQVASSVASPRHPPGLYGTRADRRALNLGVATARPLVAPVIAGAREAAPGGEAADRAFGPWLLAAALLALSLDTLISLGLRGAWREHAGRVAAAVALGLFVAGDARAEQAEMAALSTRLAYVVTGDARVDDIARAGLAGLSDYVNRRTAAALASPDAVEPGRDDLSVYPLIYWPIVSGGTTPDAAFLAAMNGYIAHGGIVLIDTRGSDATGEGSGAGFAPGAAELLRRVTAGLAIPPLTPLSGEHVLSRAFYLLGDFPGRFDGDTVWVQRDEDRANDSVSPVIVGGNDWAAAWATDRAGATPYATIPGGARQRVLAYRFGVNLVMYALTGNYKGDQVHVPAILERLGQ